MVGGILFEIGPWNSRIQTLTFSGSAVCCFDHVMFERNIRLT